VSDPFDKYAGANFVARRLGDVSDEIGRSPERLTGLFGERSFLPNWVARLGTFSGGHLAAAAPQATRKAISGGSSILDKAIRPGNVGLDAPVYAAIEARTRDLRGPKMLMLGGALATLPFAADRAYQAGTTIAPLGQAQATGETLMTDPFTSFVQKRAHEKTAGMFNRLGTSLGGMGDVIGDLFRQTIRSGSHAVGQAPRYSVPGALALGAAGLAIGTGMDVLQGPSSVGTGMEYQLAKKFIPLGDRIQATDTAASAFLSQSGKNMANLLDESLRTGANAGLGAATRHNRSFNQDLQFSHAMSTDPLLRDATGQDKQLLRRSFNSMSRFSPDLATDEFAVKNFLRESMLASNGPDYATLGNMARVNEEIAPSAFFSTKPKEEL